MVFELVDDGEGPDRAEAQSVPGAGAFNFLQFEKRGVSAQNPIKCPVVNGRRAESLRLSGVWPTRKAHDPGKTAARLHTKLEHE